MFPPPAPLITNEMLMLRAEREREQQALLEAAAAGPATPSISSALQQPLDIAAECFTLTSPAQEEKQQWLKQQEDLFIQEEVCEWDPIHRQATAPLVQRVGLPAALLVSLHSYEQTAVTCVDNAASDEQSQWSC